MSDAMTRLVRPALAALLAVLLAASASAQSFYDPNPALALDGNQPVTRRLREINEIGRWGGHDMVGDIRGALRDKSPDIRMATMRAIMRMGVDEARDDMTTILRGKLPGTDGAPDLGDDPDMRPKANEIAWAARAMGRSRQPAFAVPELIAALKYTEPGVRAAALSSLQRLTGLTQGAGRDFLIPIENGPPDGTLANKWQDWWSQNSGFTPEQWRTGGLGSQLPKDRASAARAIAAAGQTSAIPQLIDALRFEGDPSNPNAMSGVREALSQSLNNLTGLSLDYPAYAPKGIADDEWRKQHTAALDKYASLYKTVTETGVSPLVALLDAPDAKSRLSGLLRLRGRPYPQHPVAKYVEMLEDSARGVAEQAWKNLTAATGVYWPFDPAAAPERRAVQLARWKEWTAEFANKRGEGVASVFLEELPWGRATKAEEQTRLKEALDLYNNIDAIRARAAEWIAVEISRERTEAARPKIGTARPVADTPPAAPLIIAPTALIDAFTKQNENLRKIMEGNDPAAAGASSMLQRNLARAFAAMNCREAVAPLIERIRLTGRSRSSQLSRTARAAIENDEVTASCVAALGQLAPDGRRAEAMINDMLDARAEPAMSVRVQAAYALAYLGATSALDGLSRMLAADPQVRARWAAAEAMAMLAEKDKTLRDSVRGRLEAAAAGIDTTAARQTDSASLRDRLRALASALAAMK